MYDVKPQELRVGNLLQDEKGNAFQLFGIEHVHQLQNLYFALTGSELILNDL